MADLSSQIAMKNKGSKTSPVRGTKDPTVNMF